MSDPIYIEISCAECGKKKKLRVDNRTCSSECYIKRRKRYNVEYHRKYYRARKEERAKKRAEALQSSEKRTV